jgi:hypothetical protein
MSPNEDSWETSSMSEHEHQHDTSQMKHGTSGHEGEMSMSGDDMMKMRFERNLWTCFACMALGLALASSPWTFGYSDPWMTVSDLLSGVLIVVFGIISLSYERGWARWANCAVGIWLLFAPIVFWAPEASAFVADTVVGALVIAFAILVPGMPGMRMQRGPDIPPGWSYNPSDWIQRAPVIALGITSFFISRYLAAHQLGYIDSSWDPIFGSGTERILMSDVSKAWPVSDAGFGAIAYMIEALSGFMGHRNRWRTMPWMVLMFGFLVIPLGLTSIILVVMQPVMVGTWCTLCLVTALFMLLMIPLAVDEVVAMGQFMVTVRRQRKPFWVNFWRGGSPLEHPEQLQGHAMDESGTEDQVTFHSPIPAVSRESVRGVTVPASLLVSALIGFWLMGAPPALGSNGWAANSDFIIGPLVAVVAVCAWAEVIRPLRYVNIIFGAWLIAAPWLLDGATATSLMNDTLAGVALIALSVPLGQVTEEYGTWNKRLRIAIGSDAEEQTAPAR